MQSRKKKSSATHTGDAQPGKVIPSRFEKTEKNYTVIVTYVEVSEEERKIKRAIVESILKKAYLSRRKNKLQTGKSLPINLA